MSQQISPLRRRMIEDMTIRNMSPSIQKIYVAAVANFSIFHRRSPDQLTFEDVRDYPCYSAIPKTWTTWTPIVNPTSMMRSDMPYRLTARRMFASGGYGDGDRDT